MPRLFFALWPDDLVRRQIAKVAAQLPPSGKKVKATSLHATLTFLGHVEEDKVDEIIIAAGKVSSPSFKLQLDSREWWKKSQLTSLSDSEPPAALNKLVAALNDALLPCGYKPELHPFKLHVTLMRQLEKPVPHFYFKPIPWLVSGFSLIESQTHSEGVEYRVIQSWDFMG